MKEIRVFKNSKSVKLINDIVKTESLVVKVSYKTDALGDDVIVIEGETEEVNVLESIYKMVYMVY